MQMGNLGVQMESRVPSLLIISLFNFRQIVGETPKRGQAKEKNWEYVYICFCLFVFSFLSAPAFGERAEHVHHSPQNNDG